MFLANYLCFSVSHSPLKDEVSQYGHSDNVHTSEQLEDVVDTLRGTLSLFLIMKVIMFIIQALENFKKKGSQQQTSFTDSEITTLNVIMYMHKEFIYAYVYAHTYMYYA